MRRCSRSIQIALLLSFLFLVPSADASNPANRSPGSIGAFADPLGVEWCVLGIVPGAPFDVFVVSFDVEGDLFGYEYAMINPVGPFVISRDTNPPSLLDVGPGDDNWIVGIGYCMSGQGAVWLLKERVLIFAPQYDMLFCVTGASPSSPGLDGRPGWLACDETIHPYSYATNGGSFFPDGCALANPSNPGSCTVATDETSWGATKARFGR